MNPGIICGRPFRAGGVQGAPGNRAPEGRLHIRPESMPRGKRRKAYVRGGWNFSPGSSRTRLHHRGDRPRICSVTSKTGKLTGRFIIPIIVCWRKFRDIKNREAHRTCPEAFWWTSRSSVTSKTGKLTGLCQQDYRWAEGFRDIKNREAHRTVRQIQNTQKDMRSVTSKTGKLTGPGSLKIVNLS